MRYISLVLSVVIIVLFCFNINSLVLDYRTVKADENISQVDTDVEDLEVISTEEVYKELKSINDVIMTGDLDAVDISFSQPSLDKDGKPIKEEDSKKIFFFGDTEEVGSEGEGTSWSEWGQPDTSSGVPGEMSGGNDKTPIEVTFDRFLDGE